MLLVISVAVGGAAGALARYGLDRLIEHHIVSVVVGLLAVVAGSGFGRML